MPDPFVTTQDLVDYLGRGDINDPGITIATDAACDTVRTIAEQTFNAATSTVTLDGSGTDALLLPDLPVTAAGTVLVDGGTITDYVLRGDGILIRRGDTSTGWCRTLTWPAGRQNVTVTYDHGYSDAELPRDIRIVALALASRLVVQGPALQETIGNVSVRYGVNATDLTANELRILGKYRQIR